MATARRWSGARRASRDAYRHFVAARHGARANRKVELEIRAATDRAVAKLKSPGFDPAWAEGLEIEHVRDESVLLRADWTLTPVQATNEPSAEDFPQFFELLLWSTLRRHFQMTGPP